MRIKISRPKSVLTRQIHMQETSLPTINILKPSVSDNCKSAFYPTEDLLSSRFEELVYNFGLLSASISPTHLSLSPCQSSKNRSSKINLSDFMGEKNRLKLTGFKKMFPLKKKLQKKNFITGVRYKSSLYKPDNPVLMDRNVRLRIKLEEDKTYLKEKQLQVDQKFLISSPSNTKRKRVVVLCV